MSQLLNIKQVINHKDSIGVKHISVNQQHKKNSLVHCLFTKDLEKTKLDKSRWQKSWQQVKHNKLYSDLLQGQNVDS